MSIDSHTHINSLLLTNPHLEIERINQESSLSSIINVGLDIKTSKETISISKQYEKFYSATGIHPLYTENQKPDELLTLASSPKVVAIGEIGLDSTKPNYQGQRKYFIKQIMIANELGLPIIIHANNTNKEIIEIFNKIVRPLYGCVFHCFQPDIKTMEYLINSGYYISFAGRITYKTAKKSLEIARLIPQELFLVETDSPYISPEPLRGDINSSTNLKYIIERISEIKNTTYEGIDKQTTENTKRLFKRIK